MGATKDRIETFVNRYGKDIQIAGAGCGVFFSVAIGQFCHESGFGTVGAAIDGRNNIGGIKSGGKLKAFDSVQDCIRYYFSSKLLFKPRFLNATQVHNGLLNGKTPMEQVLSLAYGSAVDESHVLDGYCTGPTAPGYYRLVGNMVSICQSMYNQGKL